MRNLSGALLALFCVTHLSGCVLALPAMLLGGIGGAAAVGGPTAAVASTAGGAASAGSATAGAATAATGSSTAAPSTAAVSHSGPQGAMRPAPAAGSKAAPTAGQN